MRTILTLIALIALARAELDEGCAA